MTTALADQPTVVARILEHIDAGTTDLAEGVWREPVENYRSRERFEAEVRLMRRTPTPFCPSAALPNRGDYVARDAAMTPILAVRGADGQVRAFRNACRHRGAQVAGGHGCASTFVCPYHGWTYGLDGRLRGVPHEHGFPGLDKAAHGLAPVKAVERDGIVFVTQEGDAEPEGLPDDLLGPDWRVFSAGDQPIEANWKIVTEGVLEGYHIRATHADTFFPRQYDNLNLVEPFGRRNTRVTYPFRNVERQRDAAAAERTTRGVLTHVYHLFPNAAVATFPTHRVLTIFEPLAPDRSVTVSYNLTDRSDAPDERAAVDKGKDFVTEGVDEDRAVQYAVQRGLSAGANQVLTFGLFEGAIGRLHRHLAEALREA